MSSSVSPVSIEPQPIKQKKQFTYIGTNDPPASLRNRQSLELQGWTYVRQRSWMRVLSSVYSATDRCPQGGRSSIGVALTVSALLHQPSCEPLLGIKTAFVMKRELHCAAARS